MSGVPSLTINYKNGLKKKKNALALSRPAFLAKSLWSPPQLVLAPGLGRA